MDAELFELCKKVYELTGWATETNNEGRELYLEKWYWTLEGKLQPFVVERYKLLEEQVVCPLYTSDYLLEKLPRQIMGKSLEIYGFDEETGMYLVRYDVMDLVPSNQGWYGARADTLFKALLKLTIALSEAGELK